MKKIEQKEISGRETIEELIEALIEWQPKDNKYKKTKKLIESVKQREIEEYAAKQTKKIVIIANNHNSLCPTPTTLNPNIHNNLNIIMSFYFKIFRYLNPYVIQYINKNVLFNSNYQTTTYSENLIKYSINIHESSIKQCQKIFNKIESNIK